MKPLWRVLSILMLWSVTATAQNRVEAPKITISPLPAEELQAAPITLSGSELAVVLVIDASGSMKGLLGNATKMEWVRDTLANLSGHWASMAEPIVSNGFRKVGRRDAGDEKKWGRLRVAPSRFTSRNLKH